MGKINGQASRDAKETRAKEAAERENREFWEDAIKGLKEVFAEFGLTDSTSLKAAGELNAECPSVPGQSGDDKPNAEALRKIWGKMYEELRQALILRDLTKSTSPIRTGELKVVFTPMPRKKAGTDQADEPKTPEPKPGKPEPREARGEDVSQEQRRPKPEGEKRPDQTPGKAAGEKSAEQDPDPEPGTHGFQDNFYLNPRMNPASRYREYREFAEKHGEKVLSCEEVIGGPGRELTPVFDLSYRGHELETGKVYGGRGEDGSGTSVSFHLIPVGWSICAWRSRHDQWGRDCYLDLLMARREAREQEEREKRQSGEPGQGSPEEDEGPAKPQP